MLLPEDTLSYFNWDIKNKLTDKLIHRVVRQLNLEFMPGKMIILDSVLEIQLKRNNVGYLLYSVPFWLRFRVGMK